MKEIASKTITWHHNLIMPENSSAVLTKALAVSLCLCVWVHTHTCAQAFSCSVVSCCFWLHGLSPARLFCPWGFSRLGYWSGLPFPISEYLPDPEIEPVSLAHPALAGRFFTTASPVKSKFACTPCKRQKWRFRLEVCLESQWLSNSQHTAEGTPLTRHFGQDHRYLKVKGLDQG